MTMFTTLPNSIGEYVPGDCAPCALKGEQHTILICRNCGWPPALDGRCCCDQEWYQATKELDIDELLADEGTGAI